MAESLKCGLIGDPDAVAPDRSARPRSARTRHAPTRRRATRSPNGRPGSSSASSSATRTSTASAGNLNLGHTIGHALEIESGYRLPHGQAVVLGLRAVASHRRRTRRRAGPRCRAIDDVVARLGFPTAPPVRRRAVVRAALTNDKKRVGGPPALDPADGGRPACTRSTTSPRPSWIARSPRSPAG